MNPYVLLFFVPLSWFVAMFMMEVGSLVMLPVCKFDKYKEKMNLVVGSIWAIIATSLVYLVVSLDGLFAPVMFATGEALFGLLMVLIVILAFHHYLIGSAEGAESVEKDESSKKYLLLATPFALIVALIGNSLFTSVFSGYGIGLSLPLSTVASVLENHQLSVVMHNSPGVQVFYPEYMTMIFNAFNWVFFLGVVMYVVFFTVAFYGIKERFALGALSLSLANVLFLASSYLWLPLVFQNAVGNVGFWIYIVSLYIVLYLSTHDMLPFKQAWVFTLTFLGGMMFGLFTEGNILVDTVKGGIPASLLLTNPSMLEAGAIMVVLIGILAMGGVTAVSYEILFKNSLEKMETRKTQQS
ncbi:hypothetical protein [Sulfuracidifex metallicus]|uniref:Uncharacterized protein n=1 Tax=Sulfuracidifex metallicus DSM 6482 = JCM 9184 TaxID=523847 RepID=A0A6A9QVJ1_SULME|nr:hypothetical protein [Sulfuracidifex metallicus]MUN29783.1 hypothetical protein [Sulfuracidifex metallicus DSM 6482 = JCM 9184]WOE51835.1 hypothetical protein RQ359_001170 [Sulfuracidifex metallicus DSM 6482 = JCM 9184]